MRVVVSERSDENNLSDLEIVKENGYRYNPSTQFSRNKTLTLKYAKTITSQIKRTSKAPYTCENRLEHYNVNSSTFSIPQNTTLILIGVMLIVVIAILTAYLKDPVIQNDQFKNCSFAALKNEYPTQNYFLWESLRIGIEGVLNNKQPSPAIYLLLHNGELSSKNLVKKIALRASECLDPGVHPIELNSKDFSSDAANDDYGIIVAMYKEKIKGGGVAVIANLNEIPAETARALHAICDTYTPIVYKTVTFLTLVPSSYEGRPVDIAEKTLTEIWSSKITDYEMDSLLARVTDQVFLLNKIQ